MTQGISMKLIPALVLAAFAGTAGASGFQLQNQSGSGNGNAFAGAAAAAEDASTIFFNPAGMTNLPRGNSVSLSATALHRSIKFTDTGSTTAGAVAGTTTLQTGNGGEAGGVAWLPHGYWAYGFSPNWSVGLGIGPTFGNKTEYDMNFVGRTSGQYFEMRQININPSIAFKVNETVSLGFGVNFAHNASHFKTYVPVAALGGGNEVHDLEGKAWARGYNLGANFQLSPSTRIGLAYRSKLAFDLKGSQSFTPNPSAAAGAVNQDIKARLTTPANFSMAVSQKLSDKWEMLGDATWTGWDVHQALEAENQYTGAPLVQVKYNFKNTWRVGLGANYQANDAWKLRFGVAHDKSPVPSNEFRTMTLPDSDRTWLSFGAKYSFTKAASMDFGFSHVFFAKASTARAVTTGYPTVVQNRGTINGDFKASANSLSLQYNHSF